MNEKHSERYKNSKIKVCFSTIEFPPDIGGVSNSAERITKFLQLSGYCVHVFAPVHTKDDKQPLIQQKKVEGLVIYRIKINNQNPLLDSFCSAIAEIDKKEKFDIFHGFFLYMAYPCIKVAETNKRPVIASFRGIDSVRMYNPQYFNMAKEILQKSSWITSVNSLCLNEACTIVDIKNKSSFIFNSIVSKKLPRWELTSFNRNVIGTVATFRPKKNIPLLLEAYSNLHAIHRRKLLLVGDFIENKELNNKRYNNFMNLCQFYGVFDEVKITGYIENTEVPSYLTAMNVFVLSSKHEGLPNALIEAIAVGMPIVSTMVDGVNDILENEVNALLVPSNDMLKMRDAIEEIVKNEKFAIKLAKGALRLNRKLSPEVEQQTWLELYSRLLT